MKSFLISVFIFIFSVLLNGQIELDFYAGNRGVSSPKLDKNNDYLFVAAENILARSKDGDEFEPLIKNKSGYLLVNENNLYYLYFKKGFTFGLLFSEDNGDTWTENNIPHSYINTQSLNYKNGILSIASHSQYILHSNDNGISWDSTYYKDFAYEYPSIENNIYTVIGTRLYKINQSTKDSVFLDLKPYIKSDYVRQLVVFDNMIFIRNFSNVLVINKEIDQILSNVSNHVLYFDIIDNNLYNVSLSDVKTYNKNSNIWTTVLPSNNFKRIYSFMVFKDNSFVADNDKQIYKIDNTGKISVSGKGVNREQIYSITSGEGFIVAQNSNKISIYRPANDSWENYFETDFSYTYEDLVTNKKQMIAYLDVNGYKLRVSKDKGVHWTIKSLPWPTNPFDPPMTNFVLKAFDDLIVLTNGYNNYISSDFGDTWKMVMQGHDTNIVKYKGKYYGGGYNNTFVSDDLEHFTNKSNDFQSSWFFTSKNRLFLNQSSATKNQLLMSDDGFKWKDVSKNLAKKLHNEVAYFYEKDNYIFAMQDYGTYRLNLAEIDNGWELVDKTSFLGKIFEFDGHLLAGQAGIYKIFIGDSTLSNAYFNEVSWFTDQGDKIYLSKKAKQHQGVLYYEILIDKHDNSKISTGVYATEENGKLLLLKDNESKIYVDYNLSLDNEVQISEAKKLKLLNSEIVNNNLGLNLNKYNFLVKEIGNEENLSYTNLICNKDNFFLDDLLTQYNLSGQVTCIYLNQDLLISNDNSCNQVLHTIEVDNTTKVYPNPATNIINVSTHKKGNYYIEIYSSTGYLIHTANFTDAIELPIAEFNQGFYFIKILDNKKELIHSEKFIKL